MRFFSEEVAARAVGAMRKGFLMCGGLFVAGSFLVTKNAAYEDSSESGDFELSARNTLLEGQVHVHS